MPVESGQTLLHYRIVDKLGEGGMGVVWKATDTTLDRDVAIKILPDALAQDPERLARFEREAKSLAALNHPNIAAIHSVHEAPSDQGSVRFLAMELVPGEDLSERLERGPIPIDEALEILGQIATGLDAAHVAGLVHRDLKPANVKLTADHKVKILDFGLAKAWGGDGASASADPSLSPTMTSAGTMAGMILGTAAYMSPEQARGYAVDQRADVWALGVIFYEMLTGRRLFEGETVSDILAGVLKTDPDFDHLPSATPPAARRLLRRCLARDPQQRLHHMGDARLEIEEARLEPAPTAEGDAISAPTKASSGRERIAWVVVVLALLAVLVAAVLRPGSTPEPPRVQSTLMPPDGWDFAPGPPLAVSRDGRQVAFVAYPRSDNEEAAAGSVGIWVRDLSSTESRRLADADTDSNPFWSHDGRWIGFYANGMLNKIEADGGPVIPICEATNGRGGTWNEAGTIVFQRAWNEGLMTVPAGGGTAQPLTTLDKERFHIAHRWPRFLPDGRHFLFFVVSTTNPLTSEYSGIYIGSLDSDRTQFLLKTESRAVYAAGHLLYRAGSTLMAHPFDVSKLGFTGDPFPVASDVPGGAISWGGAQFGASEAEVLVHLRGTQSSNTVLTWRDHDGNALETIGEPDNYWSPALSHDGSRLAVEIGTDASDVWIFDLERESRTRFTFETASDRHPLWSPDDGRLAYSSAQKAEGEIWVRPTSGQGDARLVFTAGTSIALTDWSNDGRLILFDYQQLVGDDDLDIWALDMETLEARAYVSGRFSQGEARLSPDGRWVAYSSDESGKNEVYVQGFPQADGRWMVSNDGGARGAYTPVWGDDGRELFYKRGNSVLAIPLTPGAGFAFGTPRPIFDLIVKSGAGSRLVVTDDGQRILCNELPPADPSKSGARLIQNWSTALAVR
jgi:Tol biopolymer transport system component